MFKLVNTFLVLLEHLGKYRHFLLQFVVGLALNLQLVSDLLELLDLLPLARIGLRY